MSNTEAVTSPNIEFADQKEVQDFWLQKLNELLGYVNKHSKYYASVIDKNNLPDKIDSLEQFASFPFTTKDILAEFREDLLCVEKSEVADFVTTSGTLSDPVTFYLTAADIDRLAYNEAISFLCAGANSQDIFQLMTTIDKRFMAGLAYYLGIQKLGAGIIRVGPGAPSLQWDSILRFNPTFLIAIPSFIPKLLDYAEKNEIDYKSTSVKGIICIGEPLKNKDLEYNELAKRITNRWNVHLYSTYASTEMGAAFTECSEGKGGHLHPELLYLEVIDEEGNQVKDGELGEVVVTTLGVEGMPLLRYKTGDLCRYYSAKCGCGRTSARLGPVEGRKQQMIKFKGTTIFPPAIFDVLDLVPEIEMYQVEVSKNEYGNDSICVWLDEELKSKDFDHKVKSFFKSKLRVTPEVGYLSYYQLHKRIFTEDKRKPVKLVGI